MELFIKEKTNLISLLSKLAFKKPFYGRSLGSLDFVKFKTFLLQKTVYEGIKGNVIECGVYRGGTLVEMGLMLKKISSEKIIYGLDTFEGHPYTDIGTSHIRGRFRDTNFNAVKNILNHLKLDNIRLIKGLFKDTLPLLKDERFCFANIDCDLYLSHKECLEFLLPRMNPNGIIFFDDYNSISAGLMTNKAVHEFIDKEDLVIMPRKGAYYSKK